GEHLFTGYFEQVVKEKNNNTFIEEVWSVFPSYTLYEIRAALAKCGLTKIHIESRVSLLSGGEKAKVRLCKLINSETNLL
ncbi:ABC transporter ATP-binding protein, partial [Bacillus vallismortis]|nr:ABC transporter ATP-binding protein [Bacillus vallismortis]